MYWCTPHSSKTYDEPLSYPNENSPLKYDERAIQMKNSSLKYDEPLGYPNEKFFTKI